MIEIKTIRSEAGSDNCFSFCFALKDYIPGSFFREGEEGAELRFFISLFVKFGIMDKNKAFGENAIWSRHYACHYRGTPFTMVYDMDYDIVSFSVGLPEIEHKGMIAEGIRHLVETEGMNVERIQ